MSMAKFGAVNIKNKLAGSRKDYKNWHNCFVVATGHGQRQQVRTSVAKNADKLAATIHKLPLANSNNLSNEFHAQQQ